MAERAIEPALTSEEWEHREAGNVFEDMLGSGVNVSIDGGTCSTPITKPHGCAALCLHNQPFGFTRRTLQLLGRGVPDVPGWHEVKWTAEEMAEARAELRKLEALLPPEEG